MSDFHSGFLVSEISLYWTPFRFSSALDFLQKEHSSKANTVITPMAGAGGEARANTEGGKILVWYIIVL